MSANEDQHDGPKDQEDLELEPISQTFYMLSPGWFYAGCFCAAWGVADIFTHLVVARLASMFA